MRGDPRGPWDEGDLRGYCRIRRDPRGPWDGGDPKVGRGGSLMCTGTTLTRWLKELHRRHPLGEADLCQLITHRPQLRGGLTGTLGGLLPPQPFQPVGRRLEALQLPLPVQAPVPTVAEGAAAGWRAGRDRGRKGHTEPPPPLAPLSALRCPPNLPPPPAGSAGSLCVCALQLRPRSRSFWRFQGVPLSAPHLLRGRGRIRCGESSHQHTQGGTPPPHGVGGHSTRTPPHPHTHTALCHALTWCVLILAGRFLFIHSASCVPPERPAAARAQKP